MAVGEKSARSIFLRVRNHDTRAFSPRWRALSGRFTPPANCSKLIFFPNSGLWESNSLTSLVAVAETSGSSQNVRFRDGVESKQEVRTCRNLPAYAPTAKHGNRTF